MATGQGPRADSALTTCSRGLQPDIGSHSAIASYAVYQPPWPHFLGQSASAWAAVITRAVCSHTDNGLGLTQQEADQC